MDIGVETDSARVAEDIMREFAPYVRDDIGDNARILRVMHRGSSIYTLSWLDRSIQVPLSNSWPRVSDLLTQILVSKRRDLRFLHASAVNFDGRAVLFVGGSTSGKTTIALALQQNGFKPLADDVCVFNPGTREVCPFKTSANIRPFTMKLEKRNRWTSYTPGRITENFSDAKPPIEFLFFLSHDDAMISISRDVSEQIKVWRKFYWLSTGDILFGGISERLPIRNERAFDKLPRVCPCRPVETIRLLSKHLHAPYPCFSERIVELSLLAEKIQAFRLWPGELAQTASCVRDVLMEPSSP